MENIIVYILMVAIGASVVGATALLIRKFRKCRKEEAERQVRAKTYWAEERNKNAWGVGGTSPSVPPSMARYVDSLNTASPVKAPKPRKTEYTTTTSTRSSDSSDDGLLTGMLIGAAVNSLLHSSNSSASSSSSSSWGLDDDDSRKSISSSMDWGSSSSSSDSWSSSDSGPSSDW